MYTALHMRTLSVQAAKSVGVKHGSIRLYYLKQVHLSFAERSNNVCKKRKCSKIIGRRKLSGITSKFLSLL